MGFVEDVATLRRQTVRGARIGTVVTLSAADSMCTVLLGDGEVPAFLNDQTYNIVVVGSVVTVIPLGGTYEVISTHSGSAGPGGPVLGTELLPNGGFEYGSTSPDHWYSFPWVNGTVSVARDTTAGEALSGDARALVTVDATAADAELNLWSEPVLVDPGASYSGSAWVKASAVLAGVTCTVYAISGDSVDNTQPLSSGAIVIDSSVSAPGSAYQFMTGTSSPLPAGSNWARLYLRVRAPAGTAPFTVSWDEASLKQRIVS